MPEVYQPASGQPSSTARMRSAAASRAPRGKPRDTTTARDDENDDNIRQAGPAATTAEPPVAEVETLIERPDLGPGCYTRVAAGDVIPAGLRDLPRAPVVSKRSAPRRPR